MPGYVRKRIEFLPVKDMDGVIGILFKTGAGKQKSKKTGSIRGVGRERGLLLPKT